MPLMSTLWWQAISLKNLAYNILTQSVIVLPSQLALDPVVSHIGPSLVKKYLKPCVL